MRFHNTHVRDSSLRRLSRINRWLIAGSVGLTAIFTDVAAHAFPGKSATGSPAGSKDPHSHAGHRSHRASGGKATTAPRSLAPPAQAPQATVESQPTPSEEPPAEARAPAQQATTPEEPAPEPEIAQESAPAAEPEPQTPVVSGGS
jgi:hypothetical protein